MHISSAPDSLLQLLEIRPLDVDHLSTARYVVSSAFLRGAKGTYSEAETSAFTEFVRSPHYSDLLLGNRAYGAWVGSEMVGVAAWSPGEENSPTARVLAIFVHPLFTGQGIGSRLGEYLVDEAAAAGFRALETNATLNAVGFFERLDFLQVRQSVWAMPSGREMTIAIMRRAPTGRADIMH